MKNTIDLTLVRIGAGILVYVAMLGLVTIAVYSLVAGPQVLGVTEAWPLVFYFVVPYFGTMLVAFGVVAAVRFGPDLARRML